MPQVRRMLQLQEQQKEDEVEEKRWKEQHSPMVQASDDSQNFHQTLGNSDYLGTISICDQCAPEFCKWTYYPTFSVADGVVCVAMDAVDEDTPAVAENASRVPRQTQQH